MLLSKIIIATSMSNLIQNKLHVIQSMVALASAKPLELPTVLQDAYHGDVHWRGSHPWNEMHGIGSIERQFWAPLRNAFPDLERRNNMVIGGVYEGRDYVGCVGHWVGTFESEWLGVRANHKIIHLRFGEFHQLVGGRIVQSTVLIDVLDFLRQCGFSHVPASKGTEMPWLAPMGNDGIVLQMQLFRLGLIC